MLKRVFTVLVAALFLTNCSNIYEPMSGQTSDAALYQDAIEKMDAQNYAAAIADFQSMGPNFLSRTDVMQDYAGALAGECGLNFANFVNNFGLVSGNIAVNGLWITMMKMWAGISVNPAQCSQAQAEIQAIWNTGAAKTLGQEFFMVVVSFVAIGAYIRYKADIAPAPNGDGNVDAGFTNCDNGSGVGSFLSDNDITGIIVSFALINNNIAAVAALLGAPAVGAAITGACAALPAGTLASLCTATTPGAVTANMIIAMRDMLEDSNAFLLPLAGYGACNQFPGPAPWLSKCCNPAPAPNPPLVPAPVDF